MADALRSLLAEFLVSVDPQGNLAKGDAAVSKLKVDTEALTRSFDALKAAAAPAAKVVEDVFVRAMRTADRNVQALNAAAFGGRQDAGGFAAAGLAQAKVAADAAANSFGARLRGAFDRASAGAAAFGARLRGGAGSLLSGLTSLRAGIIGLATGAVVNMAKGFLDQLGDIEDVAAKLGVTNEEVQRLSMLAKFGGTSVEALGTAFRNVGRAAVDPTKESTAAFRRLDVATKDAAGGIRSRQDIFFDSALALADMGNEAERATLAQQLFGRAGIELLPLLSKGREGLEAQREAIMKMAVATDDQIAKAADFGDKWDLAVADLKVGVIPLLLQLVPVFQSVIGWVGKAAKMWGTIGRAIGQFEGNSAGAAGIVKILTGALNALLLPLKLFEDFIVFLAGGDSVLGRALEDSFGTDSPVLATVKAFFDGIFGGWGELIAFINGDTTWEEFGDRFMLVTADMAEAIDDFVDHVIRSIPIIGPALDAFNRIGQGNFGGAAAALASGVQLPGVGAAQGAGLGLGARLNEWLNGGFDVMAGLPMPVAPGAPSIDQRTQSVVVNVGSTAEVAGAVSGAQRGMGRDSQASLNAVSVP